MRPALVLAAALLPLVLPTAAADGPVDVECKVDVALHFLRWATGHEVPADRCHPPFASPWPFCPYDGCLHPISITVARPGGS